jgi:hypothetical protein
LSKAFTGFFVFDFATYADSLESGHEYEIATGYGDVCGESGAFVSDTFFDDLNKDFAAALEDFLNGRFVAGIAFVEVSGGATTTSGFVVVIIVIVVVIEFLGLIFYEVPVVLEFDVADVEEAISTNAEIDEGGLDTGFDVYDFAFVDVTDVVFCAAAFYVEFFEDAIFDDGNPAFLGLEDVDEHFLFHGGPV